MKNENGIEKSAILSGNTLINSLRITNVFAPANIETNVNLGLYTTLPPKKYILFYNVVTENTSPNEHFNRHTPRINLKDGSSLYHGYEGFNTTPGRKYWIFTANSDIVDVYYWVKNISTDVTVNNCMLLEYQEGMENWDIPYFEGMQSVKMPVLKTTGKNLFPDINFSDNRIYKKVANGIQIIKDYESAWVPMLDNLSIPMPKGDYVLSSELVEGEYTGGVMRLDYTDGTYSNEFLFLNDIGLRKSIKFNNTSDKILKRINIWNPKGNAIFQYQLEQGTVATPYEPYQSNILRTNEDVTLRGIGDVQDELDLITGEVTERIGEIVLDGSEDESWSRNIMLSTDSYSTSFFTLNVDGVRRKFGEVLTKKCDKFPVQRDHSHPNDVEGIHQVVDNEISIRVLKTNLLEDSVVGFKSWLSNNPLSVQFQLTTESIKTVVLNIKDQDNQPQERMKLFPSGYINTSSSTISPILELKGITHNNKLNMTTTNGTNNTQLATLDNLALDGIICKDGEVVRDSYDVESGLYTKRVFRFTIDEEFIERYRGKFSGTTSTTCFEIYTNIVNNCNYPGASGVKGIASNIEWNTGGEINRIVLNKNLLHIQILKEEVSSYDVDGILEWIKRNGTIEVAYQMATPQIIHIQPNMQPYVSTRPYQGSIESQGNILESSFLDYTSEQSIISPKPLGDGDVLRWEQGSQCYAYENDKEYIPLTDYNQPIGTVLDLEEEDGEQYVENLDGGEIVVDVPFKEKAVYERHLIPYEDKVIYPTQDKLDPTGKIEVDYICGETWQNPNDLSDIRHVGTLREDGQYDVTIRRSGDDEIRLMDGITNISLDGDGLNPSEFELTFFNSGGVEVGKYGDTSHILENCVLDSKLETGTIYGDTLVNLMTKCKDEYVVRYHDINNPNNTVANISMMKPNTEYTLFYKAKYRTEGDGSGIGGSLNIGTSIEQGFITTGQTYTTEYNQYIYKITTSSVVDCFVFASNGLYFAIKECVLLEGDYTNYPMDILYFEGVGSTIVNGFTVSNSDDTEMVKYTLPTSITLNKVGDVADTFDVVSGVETRKLLNLVFDGSDDEAWSIMFEAYGTAKNKIYGITIPNMTKGKDNIFTGLFIANYKYIESLADSFIGTEEGHWGVYCVGEPQIRLITPTGTSREQLKEYLQANPLKVVIKTETPQTIQHTLIPSTVETMQEPTFILPQPLRSVPNGICDRLYWDENKGHYCIEKRIGKLVLDGTIPSINHGGYSNTDYVEIYMLFTTGALIENVGYCEDGSFTMNPYVNVNYKNSVNYKAFSISTSKAGLIVSRNEISEVIGEAYTNNSNQLRKYLSLKPVTLLIPLATPKIIDLPHLDEKVELPTQPDTLPIGYKVEHPNANPQLGLTIPYKQLNYPSRPQNIDFKMDIADYVLTWDDVKEARQYNIILNDRTIATVKEPQWNSGEEMYGYIMVEAQNELAENLSEELYIKTVPNAPAQLTVAHNPMTDYYDFEISFIKTSTIAEYYTVQYRVDGGEWVYKTIQSDEIDYESKVLWSFSVYEINEQIEVWATATNDIGTNDILPTATYYMSPTPQWTYRINSKELFVRWMDDSPYDTQYKLRYQYKSDGIYRYAYFEGDKQEIGKLYEALIPLADDEEVSIALCIISEKENLYTKPIRASKELDPNIKPPKNFNYRWISRGLIEFYWEDNYDIDVQYEAIVEHRMSGEQTWIQDTQIFDSTDVSGVGTVYRLQYQMEELEEIRVKVRMKWAMNDTEWTESLTTVFIPVEGNPPTWIRRTQTKDGLLVEWEAQQYVDSYHVYVMSNGEELQHLETQDNFILVDLDYSNTIDIEIYEVSRFTGGVESDPSESMRFRPTMDKQQLIGNFYTPQYLQYEIEVDTVQRNQKAKVEMHDINTTPDVKSKDALDVAISSPFLITYHPLRLDVHQKDSKAYGASELNIKTLDVKSRDVLEVLTFERVTDQYGVDFTVYTPSASKYPITLEVNRVRIVCFGDSLTSGHPGFWMVV